MRVVTTREEMTGSTEMTQRQIGGNDGAPGNGVLIKNVASGRKKEEMSKKWRGERHEYPQGRITVWRTCE